MRHLLLFLTLFWLALAPVAEAQQAPGSLPQDTTIDYDAWEGVASRAEAAIAAGRASTDAFESLRSEIAGWRDQFLAGQSLNEARIETLRSQIAGLGPMPAEGAEAEPEEIANRRTALAEQLREARAPGIAATEAFNRADGLASEIDGIIRARQADELLRLGPTPLNPTLWIQALDEIQTSGEALVKEVEGNWSSPAGQETFRNALPVVVGLGVIALVLLFQAGRIIERLQRSSAPYLPKRMRRFARIAWSLAEIALPIIGLYAGVAALNATGLLGLRGYALVQALPQFGLYLLASYWLGKRLFSSDYYLPVPEERRSVLRSSVTSLGALYGLSVILDASAQFRDLSEGTVAVLFFPFAVLAALALLRMGRLIVTVTRPDPKAETQVFGLRWLNLAGRLTMLFGVVGAVLVGIGYLQAGLTLLFSTIGSLALLGALYVVDDLIRELYALIVNEEVDDDGEAVGSALIPTLLTLLLILCSLPLFALVWGARQADLLELWARFREGFTVGESRISPEVFLTFVIVFVALFMVTRIVQGALRSNVLPKTKIDTGGQSAIVSGVGYVGITFAALIAISTAGIDLSSIALVAGALSVGIGFGLQNIVQNFVSGIILLIERPVAEGDWVEVGGTMGIVKNISVRSTVIETFDRVDVIVPNGDFISSQVQNWTRTNNIGRIQIMVGVAYGTDTRRVHDILMEIAKEHPLVTVKPEPGVDFLGFGADSLDFRIRAVLSDVNFSVTVKTEMHHRIAERFTEEGIEIPFAQRDIWLRNPEALRPDVKTQPVQGLIVDEDESASSEMTPLEDPAQELSPEQIGDTESEST